MRWLFVVPGKFSLWGGVTKAGLCSSLLDYRLLFEQFVSRILNLT